MIPVILSGGAGTRLWPVSREGFPKPFMRLPDNQSLLQKVMARALALRGMNLVLTVTNRNYFFQTRDEYEKVQGTDNCRLDYLLEPQGRNTGPAIVFAALCLTEREGLDTIMLVLPADHLIEDQNAFSVAVRRAEILAQQNYLVTFAIHPTSAETGYGYIELGESIIDKGEGELGYRVARFVEKPDKKHAEAYLADGRHVWNSGMFCFRAGTLLSVVEEVAPDLFQAALACWEATHKDSVPIELNIERFANIPEISIDYAVMERAQRIAVVPGGFVWNDIGSWTALSSLVPADDAGNRVDGQAVLIDSHNCFIQSPERLTAVLGLNDLLIIDTADAVLVSHRDLVQDVKKVVAELKRNGHEAYRLHRTVHRPWGTYTVLEEGERFKIKRIVVRPGHALSLQMHYHRSEHWVVVSGTAKVVNSEGERLVRTNESTFIPAGTPHRLVNPGITDLVIIEVQSGEYLGEDDIVRLDDQYGRCDRPSNH